MIGLGGATKPAAPATPRAPEYRARGGSVRSGSPYIVGEKGPELFVPGASGSIATNDVYRKMGASGADSLSRSMAPVSWPSMESVKGAVAAKADRGRRAEPARRGDINITNQWTINGADDPRKLAATIDSRLSELIWKMERAQATLLND